VTLREDCSVGVFVVVPGKDDRILLVKHKYGQKKWSLPGGGIELGESVEEAAIREVKEETGLEIEISHLIGIFSLQKSKGIIILFEARKISQSPGNWDKDEIETWSFISLNDLPSNALYPGQLKLLLWYRFHKRKHQPVFAPLVLPSKLK
jgi:ADP-ribose pyrophosphatase YjhB (NUDIX family)